MITMIAAGLAVFGLAAVWALLTGPRIDDQPGKHRKGEQ